MRDELVNEARQSLQNLVSEIRDGLCACQQIAPMMMELSMELGTVKGKKSYGYLKKNLKDKVDKIVDELESVPAVHECYMKWLDLQAEVDSHYKDERRKRLRLSEQKEFRSVKNAVIREAERLRLGEVTVEEVPTGPVDECDWREQNYIYTTFLNETVPLDKRDEAVDQERKYAEDGEPSSQYVLGVLYRDGGLLMPDAVKARDWFTRSAKQGYIPAQYTLGKLLISDDPEVHDQAAGIRWLKAAARNGSPYAAYELGKAYLKTGDRQQAESYFTQAAEGENANAMYMHILHPEDISAYLKEADRRGVLAMFFLELTTGLRKGELVALLWSDLDEKTMTLNVCKQAVGVKGGGVKVTRPKTETSIRRISLSQETIDVLKREHEKHPELEIMFPSPKTLGMYYPDSVTAIHNKILKSAGLPHIRLHDLRHTFATLALQNGVDVKTVSSILGHFDAGFTLRTYTHVTTKMQEEAAATMGKLIGANV